MSGDFEGGRLRRRRRLKVLDRDAWFTWVGDEDPTDEDMKAMQALVDAAMTADLATKERENDG